MTYNPKTDYGKLPTRHKDLQERINDAYQRGSNDADNSWENRFNNLKKEHEKALKDSRAAVRLQALKEIIQLASTFGQLMNTITEAMKSEGDQL